MCFPISTKKTKPQVKMIDVEDSPRQMLNVAPGQEKQMPI